MEPYSPRFDPSSKCETDVATNARELSALVQLAARKWAFEEIPRFHAFCLPVCAGVRACGCVFVRASVCT